MELSLLLMQKIISLLLIAMAGFFMVRLGVLKVTDGRVLSLVLLYVVGPCAFLHAFSGPFVKERFTGLMLAVLGAVIIHILYITLGHAAAKRFHLSKVEEATLIYTNAGNLILPLVSSLLGEEWTFYSCAYMFVETILFWTHLYCLMSGEKKLQLKKILMNPNMIAMGLGLFLFFSNLSLPRVLSDAVASTAPILGGMSMLVIGISMAGSDLKKIFTSSARIYLLSFVKLIILPVIVLFLFKLSGIYSLHAQARQILMITTMAACGPAASTISQFAQVFERDYDTASCLNIITVLLAVVTMPFIIMLYQII